MHNLSKATIKKLVIHRVGNSGREEPLVLSERHVRSLKEEEQDTLLNYFLKGLKGPEHHSFGLDEESSETQKAVEAIFQTAVSFIDGSHSLAKELYKASTHTQVKSGDLIVVEFENVVFNELVTNAIGLFKCETKKGVMMIDPSLEQFSLEFLEGYDLGKMEKGCIIFNSEEKDGYRSILVDNASTVELANYWKRDFLDMHVIQNDFTMTKDYMTMCKSFVLEQVPEEFEVDRTVQMELLNRSSGYFEEHEEVNTKEFATSILEQPELIESFENYKEQYQEERGVEIQDEFKADKPAVKAGKKFFKSVLKLDKNFHIYVHGNPQNIESGFDEERGMKYYKVFFKEER